MHSHKCARNLPQRDDNLSITVMNDRRREGRICKQDRQLMLPANYAAQQDRTGSNSQCRRDAQAGNLLFKSTNAINAPKRIEVSRSAATTASGAGSSPRVPDRKIPSSRRRRAALFPVQAQIAGRFATPRHHCPAQQTETVHEEGPERSPAQCPRVAHRCRPPVYPAIKQAFSSASQILA